jgi:hypothetical protein
MTDLVITAASVVPTGSTNIEHGTAGATVTAGQMVYKEAATSTFKLADSNSGTAEAKTPYGMALHASLAGQPLAIAKGGAVTMGAILTAGTFYCLSETAGGIEAVADLSSTQLVTMIGYATTTSSMTVNILATGVTL